jgi:hypothetical protein
MHTLEPLKIEPFHLHILNPLGQITLVFAHLETYENEVDVSFFFFFLSFSRDLFLV